MAKVTKSVARVIRGVSDTAISIATLPKQTATALAGAGMKATFIHLALLYGPMAMIGATSSRNISHLASKTLLHQTNFSEECNKNHSLPGYRHYSALLGMSYMQRLNCFWLKFEPPTPLTFYIFGFLYSMLFIIGCGGNMFVLMMFFRNKSLLTPATTLSFNLAVSDFLMLAKCPIAIFNNFMQGPALGDTGCRIYGFLGGLSGTTSILTLTAIAMDRYYVVMHPLDPLRRRSKIRLMLIIFLIWTISFSFSIIPALDIGLSLYVPEGFLTTCSFDYLERHSKARIFMFTFFITAYLLPLNIILYSYFSIIKVVCSSNRIQANQNRNRTEQKLTIIVTVVILLWFCAWTPYSIVAMMGVFGQEKYLTPLGSMIPALFCKVSACIDPYIYATTHPRFRIEVRRFLRSRSIQMRQVSQFHSLFRARSSIANRTGVAA